VIGEQLGRENEPHNSRSAICIQSSSRLHRPYRYILPVAALSLLSLLSDETGFRMQAPQVLSALFAPFFFYGTYVAFFKYTNANGIRLDGSRIFVEGTDASIHMTEISRCRLGKNFDGTPNVIILDLTVPRLFWVPGLMLGLFRGAMFRVDEENAGPALERVKSWLRDQENGTAAREDTLMEKFIRPATRQDDQLLASILNPIISHGDTTPCETPVDVN